MLASLGVVLSGGGSLIDLDGTFFVQIAIFFLAFFILKSLVFGPVMKVMDAREAAVGGARQQAQALEAEVAEKKANFESQLRKVRDEASREREAQRAEAQKLARSLTEKARQESASRLDEARTRLSQEAEKVRAEARLQVPKVANQIASKILNRSVN